MNEFDFKNLGLNTTASIFDVKESYRALSKIYHPDNKETGNTRIFRKLTQSYQAIEDEYRRRNITKATFDMFAYDVYDNLIISFEEAFNGCQKKFYWNDLPKSVNIPKGSQPNDVVIAPKQGLFGRPDGAVKQGDLILTLLIERKDEYSFENRKLVRNIEVDIFKALTGGSLKLSHIDGKTLNITVPQGFQNGYTFIVEKRGWYKNNSEERGDLLVRLFIKNRIINFTDKQLRQLREMAKSDEYVS